MYLVVPGHPDDYVDHATLTGLRTTVSASMVLETALMTLPYQYEYETLYGVLAEYMESEMSNDDTAQLNALANEFDTFYDVVKSAQDKIKPHLLGLDDKYLSTLSYANLSRNLHAPEPAMVVEFLLDDGNTVS